VLSVSSPGGRSNLSSFHGVIFGWIRSLVWLAAKTRRQVCQHDAAAEEWMSTSDWRNGRWS